MRFGVVGDVHGDFEALGRVIADRADVAFWLSVGDLASHDKRYPELVAPLYWIQGNNEDFEFIARLRRAPAGAGNLHLLPNGTRTVVGGMTVAALGGTFAPTWYETPASQLPILRDDKRRHFVREQVEQLAAMREVDVLLTHEAPRPFIVQAGARRLDAGKAAVNEVLAAMKPRLHFFGHHHRFSETIREGVPSIGLDLVSRSYVIVDGESFAWEKAESPKPNA